MGIYIFLTLVLMEIILGVFSIITKAYRKRARSIARIVMFAGFVLLTALQVIQWSFRYYTLAILLLLLAAAGTVSLIRKRDEKREWKAAVTVLKVIALTGLFFAAALPAILFPQYKPLETTGEYRVATSAYTYVDTKRVETYADTGENRKLNVAFWYPGNYNVPVSGGCPLIVFSHGSMGIKSSNESLYSELASNGYVVCSVDHTYQCMYTVGEDGSMVWMDKGFLQELKAEDAKSDRQQSWEYYRKWMKIRTGDIHFVIEHILAEKEKDTAEKVYRLIDSEKIGVMGHSLGGSAALGIGRIRGDIGAVIALEAPFMCDIEGVEDGEFVWNDAAYPVPLLNIYSDSSWNHLGQWPQYAENYALLSDTGTAAFNIHISGAGHLTLTDLALTSPFLARVLDSHKPAASAEYCLETINRISLAFFDCYLKGEGRFVPDGNSGVVCN